MDFDYKKYSLEQLENWMHDAMSSNATPDEIYDVIVKVVRENYHHYKEQASFSYELLTKFNQRSDKYTGTYDDMIARGYWMTDDGFWMPPEKKDKVKKWVLPVEQVYDDYFVSFPDDLLEAANLIEGDQVEWFDNGDGSYTLKKVEV